MYGNICDDSIELAGEMRRPARRAKRRRDRGHAKVIQNQGLIVLIMTHFFVIDFHAFGILLFYFETKPINEPKKCKHSN
jgi:hypothetical protein